MNTIIYSKGEHYLKVLEIGEQAKIVGLGGLIDSIELMTLLLSQGYRVAM